MVCTPVRPAGQSGQGSSFFSRECGAWSEPTVSTVPSLIARQAAVLHLLAADRRVHHAEAFQPVVAVRRDLGEVVDQHLAGGDVAEILQVVEFLGGGDVQDVRRAAGGAGQRHQAPGAEEGAFLVAPFHVAAIGVARLEHVLAVLQAVFVLAVIGDAAAAGAHDAFQVLVVLDHQVAGGTAGEDLDRADAAAEFQLCQFGDVGLGAADIEAHVAPGLAFHVVLLPGELFGIGDRRRGVRHVEHRGKAAEHGGAGAGGDALHRLVAGVAQMHVRVDQAGQNVQAGGVDGLVGGGVGGHAEGGDAAVADADDRSPRYPRAARRCRCGSAGRNARACRASLVGREQDRHDGGRVKMQWGGTVGWVSEAEQIGRTKSGGAAGWKSVGWPSSRRGVNPMLACLAHSSSR